MKPKSSMEKCHGMAQASCGTEIHRHIWLLREGHSAITTWRQCSIVEGHHGCETREFKSHLYPL